MQEAVPHRPPSILAFERLYLGSTLLYVIGAVVFWSATRELMLASGRVQSAPGMDGMVGAIMIGSTVVTVLVSLLFWWLVACGRNVAGKWLVVGTEAIGGVFALLSLLRLVRGTAANVPQVALGLLVTGLAIAAAAMLFRADAKAWLGEETGIDEVAP